MDFLIAFVGAYFVGSLPTAFLLVRRKQGVDIRQAGSGNVGAYNAFEVTNSKLSGVVVALIDMLKGFAVGAICAWVFKVSFELQATAFFGTIIGHNYPVWLKFKGGRGLATAAGGLFAIGLMYTLIWCVLWGIVYRFRKDIHVGNLVAIMGTPLVLLVIPARWIEILMVIGATVQSYRVLAFVLSVVVLISHWDVVNKLRFNRRSEHE